MRKNEEAPRVSIVICTYNQQDFVRETIGSALAQTYPNIEIVLTDDGSTDDTPRILREYAQRFPDKVKVVLSEKNTGIPGNLNRGLAVCMGEWLVCLDGDDQMLPQKIKKQVTLLQQHPEATGCYHDSEVFESETGRVLGLMSRIYNGTTILKQGTIRDWFVPRNFFLPSSVMYSAAARPAHGYDERLRYLSEVVFFVEVFRRGTLLAMNEVLTRYRRHAHNVTDDPTARSLMPEYELMAYAILEARYPELHSALMKLRRSCRLAQAVRCYREGDRKRGQAIIGNIIREGAVIQGLVVLAGVSLLGRRLVQMAGGQPASRPGWVKRLVRLILG